jgi:hypothetical protein
MKEKFLLPRKYPAYNCKYRIQVPKRFILEGFGHDLRWY